MILIEDGPFGQPALFDSAEALIVARTADEVAPALAALDAARAQGKWVAGYIGYEAGYALEPKLAELMPAPDAERPLLVFGVFAGPGDPAELLADAGAQARGVAIAPLEPAISRADYGTAMTSVMAYIAAGGRAWRLSGSGAGADSRLAQPGTVPAHHGFGAD